MDNVRLSYAAEIGSDEAIKWAREDILHKLGIELVRRLFEYGDPVVVKPRIEETHYPHGNVRIVASIDLIEPYTSDLSGVSMFKHFCKYCGAPVSGLICKTCERT